MKLLRKLIYKFLGLKTYLKIISKTYLFMVSKGLLKSEYPELFFLRQIIKPGFHCIDIGANLGYYSVFLSNLANSQGRVYAVEPIPLFAEIWRLNTRNLKFKNLELFNCALGADSRKVKMGMPEVEGVLHHGMTRITENAAQYAKLFEVEMKNPDHLFAFLTRLDFIKCDVEGYESQVFLNMSETIKKFRPLVQSELSGTENRQSVIDFFTKNGYVVKILRNSELVDVDREKIQHYNQDFYFIPK